MHSSITSPTNTTSCRLRLRRCWWVMRDELPRVRADDVRTVRGHSICDDYTNAAGGDGRMTAKPADGAPVTGEHFSSRRYNSLVSTEPKTTREGKIPGRILLGQKPRSMRTFVPQGLNDVPTTRRCVAARLQASPARIQDSGLQGHRQDALASHRRVRILPECHTHSLRLLSTTGGAKYLSARRYSPSLTPRTASLQGQSGPILQGFDGASSRDSDINGGSSTILQGYAPQVLQGGAR